MKSGCSRSSPNLHVFPSDLAASEAMKRSRSFLDGRVIAGQFTKPRARPNRPAAPPQHTLYSDKRVSRQRHSRGDFNEELDVSRTKLPALPGTSPKGNWRIGTIDRGESDGRVAICAIVARPATSALNLRGTAGGVLIGTGFFVVKDGGFATGKHVAIEALRWC